MCNGVEEVESREYSVAQSDGGMLTKFYKMVVHTRNMGMCMKYGMVRAKLFHSSCLKPQSVLENADDL